MDLMQQKSTTSINKKNLVRLLVCLSNVTSKYIVDYDIKFILEYNIFSKEILAK